MNLLNVNKVIYNVFIPIWAVIGVLIIIWMFKAKPNKNITDKYPRKIIILAQRPFGKSWMKHIDKGDLKVLQNFQHRIRVCYLFAIIPTLLLILWACLVYLII